MIAVDSSVLVDLLSGTGPDAEAASASVRTALHQGPVVFCDIVLAEVCTMLKQGADVNAAQGDGMTALHWAAHLDDLDLNPLLAQAGAGQRVVDLVLERQAGAGGGYSVYGYDDDRCDGHP